MMALLGMIGMSIGGSFGRKTNTVPPPPATVALKFDDAANAMYLGLF